VDVVVDAVVVVVGTVVDVVVVVGTVVVVVGTVVDVVVVVVGTVVVVVDVVVVVVVGTVVVVVDVVVVVVVVVVVGAGVTVIGAVSPVGATVKPVAVAVALLEYVFGVDDTSTLKCSDVVPGVPFVAAGTDIGPAHVSVLEPVGFAVVAPVVDPATYEKPDGSVSTIESSCTDCPFGLLTVIV